MNENNPNADKTVKKQRRGENLKPYQFKPGQTGNPNGRPKGTKSLTNQLKAALQEFAKKKVFISARALKACSY